MSHVPGMERNISSDLLLCPMFQVWKETFQVIPYYVPCNDLFQVWKETLQVIPVVRGGANYTRFFPEGTYINAADFSSPEDLGRYLLDLSKDEPRYVDMLWRKAHFLFKEGATEMVDPFCQLCYKLNHLDRFRNSYSDLYQWYHESGPKSCHPPTDLE